MSAYAALWRPYNDMDIYVEDSNLRGFYERLFQRMLDGFARVSAIIPLNNRDAVIAEARRLSGDGGRKRFFLVDGDFEWSTGRMQRIKSLYTLRCYSIENLAWDLRALRFAAQKSAPEMTTAEIDASITDAELKAISSELFPLFVAYAVCFRLGGSCETVGYSIVRLLKADTRTVLCPIKIRSQIRQVLRCARLEFGYAAVTSERRRIKALLIRRNIESHHFISGKDYLLKIILFIFQERFKYRGNIRQLLASIVSRSTTLEVNLERAVRRAAS